jgi:hypothetical protein
MSFSGCLGHPGTSQYVPLQPTRGSQKHSNFGRALLVMIPVSMVTKMAAFVYVIQHVTMELDVISSAPAMEYVMILGSPQPVSSSKT